MKAMPFILFASLSLTPAFGRITPPFNSAVWSRFMLVHPHRLPFCPIQPTLMHLCAINNDIGAPHATMMPEIQHSNKTSFSYTQPGISSDVSLLSAEYIANMVGFYSLWLMQNTLLWSWAARVHSQPKEGITEQWSFEKQAWIERTRMWTFNEWKQELVRTKLVLTLHCAFYSLVKLKQYHHNLQRQHDQRKNGNSIT